MSGSTLFVNVKGDKMGSVLFCTGPSLLLGTVIALIHMYKNHYSRPFILSLVILPAIVQAVIMLVNGNIGTGVAVMGAFSLIRFRSVPGNAREISSIFLAMAAGLATGMGYIGTALLLVVCIGAVMLLLETLHFGEPKQSVKILKITIPENLDYEGLFDDLLQEFTRRYHLIKVKTVSVGSLYELQYRIELNRDKSQKEFLDAIRCRNGNLTVAAGIDK